MHDTHSLCSCSCSKLYILASPPTMYTVFSAASVLIVSVERRKGSIRHRSRFASP
jgi:hypothetical protein